MTTINEQEQRFIDQAKENRRRFLEPYKKDFMAARNEDEKARIVAE